MSISVARGCTYCTAGIDALGYGRGSADSFPETISNQLINIGVFGGEVSDGVCEHYRAYDVTK